MKDNGAVEKSPSVQQFCKQLPLLCENWNHTTGTPGLMTGRLASWRADEIINF